MEMTSRTALRRMGNSTGMIVPKAVLAALGAKEGEPIDIRVDNGRMVAARAGELTEEIVISAEEARELEVLARELHGAADRMAAKLDEASAAIRASLDPAREEELRARYARELEGAGASLADWLFP